VRRAARIVVDYFIDDEEEFCGQNKKDEQEESHAVLAGLRLLDRWLGEEPATAS